MILGRPSMPSRPSGRRLDAVEVAAQPDVVDARDLRDVLDVIDEHAERHLRQIARAHLHRRRVQLGELRARA